MEYLLLTTTLLVTLKLTHYIDWNWFLVLLPVLIGPSIVFCFIIISAFVGIKARMIEKTYKK